MSSEIKLRRYLSIIIILCLIALVVLILKPIFLAIVTGLILAYMFHPVYKRILSFVKEKNTSAFIIIFIVFLIIFLPFWFLFPIIIKQMFNFFLYLQTIDLVAFLRHLFPAGVFNEIFYTNLSASLSGFIGKLASGISASFSSFIINLPNSMLQALITLFALFYSLKDSQKFGEYVKSISPFSEKTEQRLMSEFKNITRSVVYGSILTSVIMGVLIGIGFFVFSVPNALLLTMIAIVAGMLPILGMWMVWLPASIYLISGDHVAQGALLAVYSLIITFVIDGMFRAYYLSKVGKMHGAIALIGMIGGLFAFGVLGFIIGPLILSYLLVLFEAYRHKELSNLFN